MHDWWLALVTAAFGHICPIYAPTVLYRQHGGNNIGAKKVRSLIYIFDRMSHIDEMAQAVNDTYRQANSLLIAYNDMLSTFQVNLLKSYSAVPRFGRLKRILTIAKYGTYKNGAKRKLAQLFIVMKERRSVQ